MQGSHKSQGSSQRAVLIRTTRRSWAEASQGAPLYSYRSLEVPVERGIDREMEIQSLPTYFKHVWKLPLTVAIGTLQTNNNLTMKQLNNFRFAIMRMHRTCCTSCTQKEESGLTINRSIFEKNEFTTNICTNNGCRNYATKTYGQACTARCVVLHEDEAMHQFAGHLTRRARRLRVGNQKETHLLDNSIS